ncbi:thiol-disulfide oxidoreductase DCC family protein [Dinghuibacter silviterrae]|uniref:Putative DCC family thiol-disulfide oxidoreductase YuxK n=1 Tax=Dinghuibacter silviterrae TaxID=1539049 RepID=A0A4R8DTA1_9BACT|nr:DCC1-like thiol-disulfide oxidoreductase family protein [Dinghuibacter silviterrae]TDX00645.1 putative DCC family thiol-disulfide oxidoreductase YuxK [Dinghuibacter silviterrae]
MEQGPLLLFDGVCNLCNRSVQFVIRHDKGKIFLFAPLQGESAKKILTELGIKETLPEQGGSVFLVDRGKLYSRSDAVLETLWILGWRWTAVAKVLPRGLRDWVYDWIARNRYRWFGKREACMIPTPALRARFLP